MSALDGRTKKNLFLPRKVGTYSVVLGSIVKTNGMNEAKETQTGYQEVLRITAIRGNGDRAVW